MSPTTWFSLRGARRGLLLATCVTAPALGCAAAVPLACLCCTPKSDPMTAQLLSTSEGQTLVLTLSNPEFRNALGPEMYAAGVEALSVAESSADVRSVVITGANGIFSAGGNLQRLQNNRQLPPEHQAQSIEGLHNWIEAIRTFPKPVIAAVEGPAAGAGLRGPLHWQRFCMTHPTTANTLAHIGLYLLGRLDSGSSAASTQKAEQCRVLGVNRTHQGL